MRLNKVNLCWVMSEGRKGHEIQSMTLANSLAKTVNLYPFVLSQPWKALSPRVIPGFKKGLTFLNQQPNANQPPQIIITTGRKAAAVGKFTTQKLRKEGKQIKHIQILNPKDSHGNYDLLLIPEHDKVNGGNIVTYKGSLHPYSPQWFQAARIKYSEYDLTVAVLLGNPSTEYFNHNFKHDLDKIRAIYPHQALMICGSPRLSDEVQSKIKTLLKPNDHYWFNQHDGPNPYPQILIQAKHIFVTADSINMMNECAGSNSALTLLATDFVPSNKHQRFINSLQHRWQGFANNEHTIKPSPYVVDNILNHTKLQNLISG